MTVAKRECEEMKEELEGMKRVMSSTDLSGPVPPGLKRDQLQKDIEELRNGALKRENTLKQEVAKLKLECDDLRAEASKFTKSLQKVGETDEMVKRLAELESAADPEAISASKKVAGDMRYLEHKMAEQTKQLQQLKSQRDEAKSLAANAEKAIAAADENAKQTIQLAEGNHLRAMAASAKKISQLQRQVENLSI